MLLIQIYACMLCIHIFINMCTYIIYNAVCKTHAYTYVNIHKLIPRARTHAHMHVCACTHTHTHTHKHTHTQTNISCTKTNIRITCNDIS